MRYHRTATDLDEHPKIRAAGADAREVFSYVLRINGKLDRDGSIPGSYIHEGYMAERLMRERRVVRRGLERCIEVGLLRMEPDGTVSIPGWDGSWRPRGESGRDRVARHRAKQRETLDGDVTVGNDVTDRRVEERRGEEDPPVVPQGDVGRLIANRLPPPVAQTASLPLVSQHDGGLESPSGKGQKRDRDAKRAAKLAVLARHRETCERVWVEFNRLRQDAIPGSREIRATDALLLPVAERLDAGHTFEDCIAVLEAYAAEARGDPKQRRWFNPDTPFRPDNFARNLGGAPNAANNWSTFR